jgi:hypothetical protein
MLLLAICRKGDSLAVQDFKSLSLPKLTRADITHCPCYFPVKALPNTGYLLIYA